MQRKENIPDFKKAFEHAKSIPEQETCKLEKESGFDICDKPLFHCRTFGTTQENKCVSNDFGIIDSKILTSLSEYLPDNPGFAGYRRRKLLS
jgi:hypothetical protein